jgi:chromosome segregation ATPase
VVRACGARSDTARKIKEVRGEEKLVLQQLEMKKAELQELQEQIKPSPVRAKHEADVARLRKEVAAHSASRTHAEREGQAHSKRLLRVRAVLQSFLKAEGFKPQQPLPPADDELAGRLVDYILNLNEKVGSLRVT